MSSRRGATGTRICQRFPQWMGERGFVVVALAMVLLSATLVAVSPSFGPFRFASELGRREGASGGFLVFVAFVSAISAYFLVRMRKIVTVVTASAVAAILAEVVRGGAPSFLLSFVFSLLLSPPAVLIGSALGWATRMFFDQLEELFRKEQRKDSGR